MALTLKRNKSHSNFWGNKTSEIIALVGGKLYKQPISSHLTHTHPACPFSPGSFLNSDTCCYHLPNHIQKKSLIAVLGKTVGKGTGGLSSHLWVIPAFLIVLWILFLKKSLFFCMFSFFLLQVILPRSTIHVFLKLGHWLPMTSYEDDLMT